MSHAESENLKRIKNKLRDIFPILQKKYKIKNIEIFGSYVRKEEKQSSDLDLLVEFTDENGLGLLEFIDLENYLSEAIKIKVDLVMKDTLKARIKPYILKEAIGIL